MSEFDLIPFLVWSAVTGVVIVISGLSYYVFQRRKKNEAPST